MAAVAIEGSEGRDGNNHGVTFGGVEVTEQSHLEGCTSSSGTISALRKPRNERCLALRWILETGFLLLPGRGYSGVRGNDATKDKKRRERKR